MIELFTDYTLRTVALGSALLGALTGGLGTFALLRRQSLLGDAISHAALPGIAAAFLATGSKNTFTLLLGAALAGWVATGVLTAITSMTRISEDTALGLVLSVMFGTGMMLLTIIQARPDASQAGLDRFLFGQAAAIVTDDLIVLSLLAAAALAVVLALWKELKLLSFDPDFAATLGFPLRRLETALLGLLVVAIVVGLQTAGVVLVSALVVAPAAAARQWTDRLAVMAPLAAIFGAVSGAGGAALSSTTPHVPTGPIIVMVLAVVAVFSLLFAPARGLLWAAVARSRRGKRLRLDAVLSDLYLLSTQHADPAHGHPAAVIATMRANRAGVARSLAALEAGGLARRGADDTWTLTDDGLRRASAIVDDLDGEPR